METVEGRGTYLVQDSKGHSSGAFVDQQVHLQKESNTWSGTSHFMLLSWFILNARVTQETTSEIHNLYME